VQPLLRQVLAPLQSTAGWHVQHCVVYSPWLLLVVVVVVVVVVLLLLLLLASNNCSSKAVGSRQARSKVGVCVHGGISLCSS
jgi:hypothetical protein